MATDNKLCMLKKDFDANDDLKSKLKSGNLKLDDLKGLFELKDFEKQCDKNDFYIVESSFFLKHEKENENSHEKEKSLFVINRSPISFDGGKRISKGLSFLFSFTPNFEMDIKEQYQSKIKTDMSFINLDNEVCETIDIKLEEKGMGYNKKPDKATYIFFVYKVMIETKLNDILHISREGSLDYVFQVDANFMKIGQEYFMNPNLYFDISVLKGLFSETHSSEKTAEFFYKPNLESQVISIDMRDSSQSFWSRCKDFLYDNYNTIFSDAINIARTKLDLQEIINSFRCLYQVPITIMKIGNKGDALI